MKDILRNRKNEEKRLKKVFRKFGGVQGRDFVAIWRTVERILDEQQNLQLEHIVGIDTDSIKCFVSDRNSVNPWYAYIKLDKWHEIKEKDM